MTLISPWLAIGVATAALGIAGLAQAKASGNAVMRFHGYTLFDLNPSDGIAPALTLTFPPYGNSGATAAVYDYAADLYPYVEAVGTRPFAPVAASASTSHGAVRARVTGGGTFDSVRTVVSGWIASDGLLVNNALGGAGPAAFDFTLTPWTAVSFNADVSLKATTTIGFDGGAVGGEYTDMSAVVGLVLDHGGGTEMHSLTAHAFASADVIVDPFTGDVTYSGQSRMFSGDLSLGYANASAGVAAGSYFAGIGFDGNSPFAVPEPGTWALMLAGLGAVGLASRRRCSD